MKKTKFKKPNNSRTPPLTFLDKTVYFLLFALSVLLFLGLYIAFKLIKIDIALNDVETVAYYFGASELFALPFFLFIEISLICAIASLHSKKIPIFGNRKIEYGVPPWDKNIYPIFDKRRKLVYKRPSEKKFRKTLVLIWCAVLCVTIIFLPFSFSGRNCLQKDNSIVFYNVINEKTDKSYAVSDYSSLKIKADFVFYGLRSVTGYWDYSISIKMKDGKTFSYSSKNFVGGTESKIEKMLEIKDYFPADRIDIIGVNNLQKVEKENNMNEKEIKLLEKLFE